MPEADIDPEIQAKMQLGDIIEAHEDADWSEISEIDAAEAAAWVERLKEAQAAIDSQHSGGEAAVTASEATPTAAAYARTSGEEYADVAAEYGVRGPTSDQRVELEAEAAFGEVALTFDRTEAKAVSRRLSKAVTQCGPPERPE